MFGPRLFIEGYRSYQAQNSALVEKFLSQTSCGESVLIPISLLAVLILSSLTLSGHVNPEALTISSMVIIGVNGVVTLASKESKLSKIFEVVRLAISMVVLALTLKGLISISVTAPLLIALTGFSYCCFSNSALPVLKYLHYQDVKETAKVEQQKEKAAQAEAAAIAKARKSAKATIFKDGHFWGLAEEGHKIDCTKFLYTSEYVKVEGSVIPLHLQYYRSY